LIFAIFFCSFHHLLNSEKEFPHNFPEGSALCQLILTIGFAPFFEKIFFSSIKSPCRIIYRIAGQGVYGEEIEVVDKRRVFKCRVTSKSKTGEIRLREITPRGIHLTHNCSPKSWK